MPSTDKSYFNLIQNSRAILSIPNNYGRIQQQGLFRAQGIATTSVRIYRNNGVLGLLPAIPREAEPTLNQRSTNDVRVLELLHYALTDRVLGSDVQNAVDITTGETLTTITKSVADTLILHRNKHAVTKEFACMGALKGVVVNDDNSTLRDLFTEFGITKKTVTIPLSVSTTDVRSYCHAILRHMEDNLLGETMNGVECWCSTEFFDTLVGHEQVQKTYLNYQEAAERVGGDVRLGFTYGGIKFSEYRAVATDRTGTSRRFIAANYAHAFPLGTVDTFEIYYGPPVITAVNNANVIGQELYALQTTEPKARWIEIDTESNLLPICRRPGLLVEVTHN